MAVKGVHEGASCLLGTKVQVFGGLVDESV